MLKRFANLFLFSLLLLTIVNCANRGRPDGGPKDETPPTIIKTEPENQSTNFSGNEIKIYFDEYIKIKNLQRNLIISPPMDPEPEITPLGSASKSITIKIRDTLEANTTYAFNFGESIVDNNEENPYPFYRFVFSTGDSIDSLQVGGNIVDALNRTADEFVSVMLYEVDSTFNDSVIYNEKPKYITNTLDSTTVFQLENLKAGKYLMIALKEENQNYTFQPKTDKIGFVESYINVPTDSSYIIKMFNQELDFKATRPSLVSGQKIAFGYEGSSEHMKIKLLSETPEDYDFRLTKDTDQDSLYYWFKPVLEIDSLLFEVSSKDYLDTLSVRLNNQAADSLTVTAVTKSTLLFTEDFKLTANNPIVDIDKSKVSIMNKDSVNMAFEHTFDALENIVTLKIAQQENQTYTFNLLPGALTDFFGFTNDTLNFSLRTRAYTDYGDARISLVNPIYPVIVQLVDERNEVKYEYYATEDRPIEFRHVQAGIYYLRVIFDANQNGRYDAGNFLLRRLPERVSYNPDPIEIRANWGEVITFTLLD